MQQRLPLLDIFVLSLLDRGLTSYYDLQRQGGLSLGASTPSLERLRNKGLVTRATDSKGDRKKYRFGLTNTGRRAAQTAWRSYLSGQPPADIDAILRLVDLALHYGASPAEVSDFALKAAEARIVRSQQLTPPANQRPQKGVPSYPTLRSECDHATLKAEAVTLAGIAQRFGGTSKPARRRRDSGLPVGQQYLTY